MIATITLLSLAAGPVQEPRSEARLHPADAVVYLEIPDVQAVGGAYAQTAYGRLLADETFQAAIGGILGVESFDPLAELELLYEGGVERGEILPFRDLFLRPLRSFSFSLSARDGQLGPILRALQNGAPPSGTEDMPSFLRGHLGLQVALTFESRVAAQDYSAFVLALLEGQGGDRSDEVLRLEDGREVSLTTIDTGIEALPTLRFLSEDARVVLLSGMHSTDACAGRLAGGSTGLAGGAGLTAGAKLFGPRMGTVVFEGFSSVGDQLVNSMDLPDIGPAIDVLEGLLGPVLTMITRGGHWRVQLADGRFVTEGFHPIPHNGPLDSLFSSAPLEDGAFDLVDHEAIVAWIAHLDRKALLAALAQLAPATSAEDSAGSDSGNGADSYGSTMDEIERTYGFRPDRDLVEPLGSAVAWSLPPVRSLLAAPPFMVTIGLHDAPAFARGMDGVFAMLAREAEGEIAVSTTIYRDAPMYTIQFLGESNIDLGGLPIDPMGFFKPTITILPDRVFVTTLPSHAKREIRRVMKAEPQLHPLLVSGGFPEDASEVGFANWVSFVGKIYDGLVPLAAMAKDALGPIPIDLASLPKSDVFTGFFAPAVRWERRTENGVLHHAESSFGPEVPFAIAVAGAGSALVAGSRMNAPRPGQEFEIEIEDHDESAPEAPKSHDAALLTSARLAEIRVALTVYQLEHGAVPADLKELSRPTTNYPRGFLGGDDDLSDGWGRPLRYERTAVGYELWSAGPDGVDEAGAGDDILSR